VSALLPDGVFLIASGTPDASLPSAAVVGSKAHNLARMARLGLPVPPAFVIDTSWCGRRDALTPATWQPALQRLEGVTGLRFGDARRPLLVSVRSGAPVSMPGMMETLLNIGLNDSTVHGLVRLTGNPRLAWDAYRRLIASFGEVVLGLPASAFDEDLQAVAGTCPERELDFGALRSVVQRHLATIQRLSGRAFPQDPHAQLQSAIAAVFASWWSDRAANYRRVNQVDETLGTAATVQRMVFGNGGGDSGAGVGFTRHPSTGEPVPWVDFLFNAQGEDVVSGRRDAAGHEELAAVAPGVWQQLLAAMQQLEVEFGDMQDFEFTVEAGRLYLLQTRSGKRTPRAAARIALDLLETGLIDRAEALRRTASLDEAALTESRIAPGADGSARCLARAQSACTGVASGEIALDESRARQRHDAGAAVVLVRQDAETRDIAALELAVGLLTARGARTSHAAVVARQLGRVCLVGCTDMQIDSDRRTVRWNGQQLAEGDWLTLDGQSGAVYAGVLEVIREAPPELMKRLHELRHAGSRAATD
jgi:pyruvate,orthophosphate dikinase